MSLTIRLFEVTQKNAVTPCFSFSDSFIFSVTYDLDQVPEANFWEDYAKMAPMLDTSTYSLSHPLFQQNQNQLQHLLALQKTKKKKLGMYKDEIPESQIISEVTALKPKMYALQLFSLETQGFDKKQTAKGIPKHIIKNQFDPKTYKDCLRTNIGNMVSSHQFRNSYHQLYLMKLKKHGLGPYQDKSFALNTVETIPYGHYKIPEYLELLCNYNLNDGPPPVMSLNHYI